MSIIKLAFSIFWRFFLILFTISLIINFLMSPIESSLIKQMGAMYIKLKPSLIQLLFTLCLLALTSTKFISLNSIIWKRVFTIPLNWITCYKIYAIVCITLSAINLIVALLASDEGWVNYKLMSVLVFLLVPIALSYKLSKKN